MDLSLRLSQSLIPAAFALGPGISSMEETPHLARGQRHQASWDALVLAFSLRRASG